MSERLDNGTRSCTPSKTTETVDRVRGDHRER